MVIALDSRLGSQGSVLGLNILLTVPLSNQEYKLSGNPDKMLGGG